MKNSGTQQSFLSGYPDGNLKTRLLFIPACYNTLKITGIVQARYFAGSFPYIIAPFAIIRHFWNIFLTRGHRFLWRKYPDPRIANRSP